MISNGMVVVKQLPDGRAKRERREFLAEVKQLARESYRPQLIVDLPSRKLTSEVLDLLLSCAEQMEKSEGRVSVAGASPEAAVILELTQLTSVVNVFPSISEAVGIDASRFGSEDLNDGRHLAA
jgi:anti-anti-sigma regulatory factor